MATPRDVLSAYIQQAQPEIISEFGNYANGNHPLANIALRLKSLTEEHIEEHPDDFVLYEQLIDRAFIQVLRMGIAYQRPFARALTAFVDGIAIDIDEEKGV